MLVAKHVRYQTPCKKWNETISGCFLSMHTEKISGERKDTMAFNPF